VNSDQGTTTENSGAASFNWGKGGAQRGETIKRKLTQKEGGKRREILGACLALSLSKWKNPNPSNSEQY